MRRSPVLENDVTSPDTTTSDVPRRFFDDLCSLALASAKQAPSLVSVLPLSGRGWRLGFQVTGGPEILELNAIASPNGRLSFTHRPITAATERRIIHVSRVARMLCVALGRSELPRGLPAVVAAPEPPTEEAPPAARLSFWLEGECDRGCIFCPTALKSHRSPASLPQLAMGMDVSTRPDWNELSETLRAKQHEAEKCAVEWSGQDCLLSPSFDPGLRLAFELGYRNMGIQTPGSRLLAPGFIDFLVEHSITRVALTAHAGDAATFDRVGGKLGAYDTFWTGFEAVLAAGMAVSLEVPCVLDTVGELPEHLARLAAYDVGITCFFWYPDPSMEDMFPEIGMPFERALASLDRARKLVPAGRIAIDGIPMCVAPQDLREHYFWSYGARHMSFIDFERVEACASCSVTDTCPGAAPVYTRHHPTWPGTPLPPAGS